MRIHPAVVVVTLGASLALSTAVLHAQGRHTHGEAELDIGIDGRTVTMELRIPGDDLYGFEHAARNAAERAKRDVAVAKLRSNAATLVQFDPVFACRITPGAVTFTSGEHAEVHVRYNGTCQKAPLGRDIRFGVSRVVAGVHTVRVQLISDTGQSAVKVVDNAGVLRP